MLSLAMNYQFSKLSPMSYYFTNIVIHVFNACLVFFLVLMLLQKMENKGYGAIPGKEWLSAFAALCFGIHPLHVESVSWLTERKDVLYCFFYFLALIAYVKYTNNSKIKWLVYTFVLFICSLLSKPLAVVFPFSLFAFDVLLWRKVNRKLFIEKIPFFLVSVLAGLLAWDGQKADGTLPAYDPYSFFQRILLASNNFMMYFIKAFVPFNLSSFYPFPNIASDGVLPGVYYISLLANVSMLSIVIYRSYKAGEKYLRVVIFGFAFFFFNLMYVLQFIPFGLTVRSDRYTYVAYFGIFFAVVYFIHELWQKASVSKGLIQVGTILFVCVLGYQCYGRTKVWHNTVTLWTDVLQQYPEVGVAYNYLGSYYFNYGDPDKALDYYKKAIQLHTFAAKAYSNIGNIYAVRKQVGESFEAYKESLKLDSTDYITYLNIGVTYSSIGKYDSAEMEYEQAYRLNPKSEKVLHAMATNCLDRKQFSKAAEEYKKLIAVDPDVSEYYEQLGIAEGSAGNAANAITDFNHALEMDPNSSSCMFNLSVMYDKMQNYASALTYALRARQAGYQVPSSYISDLQQRVNSLPK
jgi:tetratricopeptide (TPR) repeat protein